MLVKFQDEFATKLLFGRIKKEIKEEQLEKAISNLDYLNKARKTVITRCDMYIE